MSRPLTDFTGNALYLDTMIPLVSHDPDFDRVPTISRYTLTA
jgi:hypothetical protein